MRRKIFRGVVVLAVLGLAFLGWAVWMSGILHRSAPESRQVASSVPSAAAVASQKAWAEPRFASIIARGEYLARAGDCVACHTMRGGAPYAGGLATPTPFGLLYSPNITPDKQYGIGNWTEDEFWRAMHDGIAPSNKLLYPVFPFTHFTKISRPDVDAIFAYLRSLPPAAQPNHPNEMPFPFNQRSTLVFWRALFFRAGEFKPDPKQSPEWNRGAYLVEGLGHCGMCHSSFNALGATDKNAQLAGGLIPIQRWYAPALNSGAEVGLGDWTNDELAQFLKTGVSVRGATYGPMSDVVFHSMQYLSEPDLQAIATYLRAQPALVSPGDVQKIEVSPQLAAELAQQGRQIYVNHCAECHQLNGRGVGEQYPPLAGNPSIAMQPGTNAIRMVLLGGFQPGTKGNLRPYSMPPFAQMLNDHDVAAVVTYIRQAWGNNAPAVSPSVVTRFRQVPE